jgi:hypothetical protein
MDVPILFEAKMYDVPEIISGKDDLIILIRNDLFRILFRAKSSAGSRSSVTMEYSAEINALETMALPASRWRDFYGFMAHLAAGPVLVEISPRKMKSHIPVSMTAEMKVSDHLTEWVRLTSALQRALERAAAPNSKVTLREIYRASDSLGVLLAMLDDPEDLNPLTFQSETNDRLKDPQLVPLLYVCVIRMDRFALVYAAKLSVMPELRADNILWTGTVPEVVSIKRLKNVETELPRFLEQVSRETGIQSHMVADRGPSPSSSSAA